LTFVNSNSQLQFLKNTQLFINGSLTLSQVTIYWDTNSQPIKASNCITINQTSIFTEKPPENDSIILFDSNCIIGQPAITLLGSDSSCYTFGQKHSITNLYVGFTFTCEKISSSDMENGVIIGCVFGIILLIVIVGIIGVIRRNRKLKSMLHKMELKIVSGEAY